MEDVTSTYDASQIIAQSILRVRFCAQMLELG